MSDCDIIVLPTKVSRLICGDCAPLPECGENGDQYIDMRALTDDRLVFVYVKRRGKWIEPFSDDDCEQAEVVTFERSNT